MKMKDEKTLVRIKQVVELGIFDITEVKTKIDTAFNNEYNRIVERCNEILAAGNLLDKEFNLSYDNIMEELKRNFCRSIYEEAIKMTLMGQGNYNMITNVMSIISEREFIKDAIMGEAMVNAVISEIRCQPKSKEYDSIYWGAVIGLIRSNILDK